MKIKPKLVPLGPETTQKYIFDPRLRYYYGLVGKRVIRKDTYVNRTKRTKMTKSSQAWKYPVTVMGT